MADEKQVLDLLTAFANAGHSKSDIMKILKTLSASGVIKSKKGKAPIDDPVRNSIRDTILQAGLLAKVVANIGDSKSYMVTLDKDYSVNFVKHVAKVSKKKDKLAEPAMPTEAGNAKTENFAEPTLTV